MSQITEINRLEPYTKSGEAEIFIGCASYEERCTDALLGAADDYHPKGVVLFYGSEFVDKGKCRLYLEKLRHKSETLTEEAASEIHFETASPSPCVASFKAEINRIMANFPGIKITLDVTTFPRQVMFPLLRQIRQLVPDQNLRILYSQPLHYSTEKSDGWLTRGVRSVVPILGFGGVQDPLLKKLLVMLPGHEGERAYITWRRHQPEKTVLLRQGTPYHEGLNDISERENELLRTISGDVCLYEPRLPAREVDGTYLELEKIYARYAHEYYFVVAPLGTKLQTLGFYLFADSRPDVQVTYAVPIQYNYEEYSSGPGRLWQIKNLNPYLPRN
jgi:hypothetical protein